MNIDRPIEILEKLADGYSTQSKTANQFWLVLIISCMVSLTATMENGLIELPFTLGKVQPGDFYAINTFIISVLTIGFTSAMIQNIRTRMLIQILIDDISENDKKTSSNIHIQDILDCILVPTYNRVAPISQFILGKNQFLGQGKQSPNLRILGLILYIVLKITVMFFVYFLPVLAILNCLNKIDIYPIDIISIGKWIYYSVSILSFLTIFILLFGDIKYLFRVVKKIKSS